MSGETQHAYGVQESDTGSKEQDKDTLLDQLGEKSNHESAQQYKGGSLVLLANSGSKFAAKEKENSQREAIIRPQQTGKIDFKSLQNRPKFSSNDRPWASSKGSPQSPSGKKTREKGKKSSKSERSTPQQLYRLSMTNSRTNPTIGIAYPQQKVTPPKKLETSRGPISGSYRFHVPSIPEREAELQQQELSYSRCFQEASSSSTSTNYTSQAASTAVGTPVSHQSVATHQLGIFQASSAQPGGQLHPAEFQVNGTSSWQPSEKTYNGANYGGSSHKLSVFTEANKTNASFVPLPFQYEYPSLQESATDPFPCDQSTHSMHYIDISLPNAQMSQSPFIHSSGDGQDDSQTRNQFDLEQPEGRLSYPQPPPTQQHAQYLQNQHGAQPSLHCYKGRTEHCSDNEGLISNTKQLEQNSSILADNSTTFQDSTDVALVSVSKSLCPTSDTSLRLLAEGNSHLAQNIAQGSESQLHLQSKACSSSLMNTIHVGSISFEKSLPCGVNKNTIRLSQSWEGDKKVFPPLDQNSATLHSSPYEKSHFQCQSTGEQKQHGTKNRNIPWQQIHLTPAMSNQNRIELSRQLSSQKLTFLTTTSDWQDNNEPNRHHSLNSPDSFRSKRPSESFSEQQESIKQNCSTISVFPFDSSTETSGSQVCDSRSKSPFFGQKQSLSRAIPRSSHPPLQVPPVCLSPCNSPLASPMNNTVTNSACSSLSPNATSPLINSEDGQLTTPMPPPPFYHQHQGKMLIPSDHLNSDLQHFHSNISRAFLNLPDKGKEDTVSNLHNIKYKPTTESSKSFLHGITAEQHPPPSYSAHQLLASSLATANLDQLDVLFTCKQCDRNFQNLASFLEHKQYCGHHTQRNEFKHEPKIEDPRKCQIDSGKMSGSTFSLTKFPSDMHLSLLGLNKNGELISDTDIKGESKDDPSKLNLFAANSSLPDLEMDDAKLDSLITETLNGLGYQSDNSEIDSSFIDAFADDELSTSKVTGNMQMLKNKDCATSEGRNKHVDSADEKPQTQGRSVYDTETFSKAKVKGNILENKLRDNEKEEKANIKEVLSHYKERSFQKAGGKLGMRKGERNSGDDGKEGKKDAFTESSRNVKQSKIKGFQERYSSMRPVVPHGSSCTQHVPSQKTGVKYSKKRKAGSGTWSKELIHKIVQQKNKLHKLHTKGNKNEQYSLMLGKGTPVTQNPKYEQFNYVSDSDEDYEPLKIVHQGRLGHSRQFKYTYSKEYKRREQSKKGNSDPWNCESKESVVVNVAEDISPSTAKQISTCRVRSRRSSRSSTSSEHSTPTSLSCESIYSPKNTDRTDSDNEKGLAMKKITSSNVLLMDYYVHDVYETSTVETCKEPSKTSSQLFSRNTKRYGSAKFLLSANINTCRIGVESTSELSNSSKSLMRYNSRGVSSQDKDQQCSSDVMNKGQTAEESVSLRRKDRKLKEPLKTSTHDSYTTGPHSELLPTEIKQGISSKHYSSNIKDEIVERGEPEHNGTCSGTLPHPCKDLLSRAEMSVIPNKNEMNSFGCHVDAKSLILCSSPVDDMHRCPSHVQDPVVPKEITVPDLTEADQSLVKSPLPFDTSSLFGDLTVTGFDSSIYSDISINNEGFSTFGSKNDKKGLFDSTFSAFLRQKDWGLLSDVTPIIRDDNDNPQFKDHSDKATLKKIGTCHTDLILPDKILDYNTNPSNNVSEDELEIKKIVTELESKLQNAKQSSSALNPNELSKKETLEKTTSFHMDHDSENEMCGTKVRKSVETARIAEPGNADGSNLLDSYSEAEQSWSNSFNFGLLEGHECVQTPAQDHGSVKPSCVKKHSQSSPADDRGDLQSSLKTLTKDTVVINKTEEAVASEMYDENLMKCLQVISDVVLPKHCLTADQKDSNLSPFLNRPCNNGNVRSEEHSEIQLCQTEELVSQESNKIKEVLFSFDNCGDSSLVATSIILPNQKESVAESTVFEIKSEEHKDITVKDNISDTVERQVKMDVYLSDLETSNVKNTDEKIRSDETSDSSEVQRECGRIIGDRGSVSQQQNLLCSTVKKNESRPVTDMDPNVLFVNFTNSSKEASVKKSTDDIDSTKKIPETLGNMETAPISLAYKSVTDASVECSLITCRKDKNTKAQKEEHNIVTSSLEKTVTRLSGYHSTLSDIKELDSEKLLLTFAEQSEMLLKNPLDASAFENDCKLKITSDDDVPKQVLSDLITSPLRDACTGETIKNNETCMSHGNTSPPNFGTPKSLLPSVGETVELDKCHSHRMWNHFEAMSPLDKNFEMNTNEIEACNSPVPPISGMSDLLAGLPHVDLEIVENKNAQEDYEVNTQSSASSVSTYKHSDCLIINKKTLKAELTDEHPLYELKESSLDFKETPDIDSQDLDICSGQASSNGLNQYMESHSTLKNGSKDNTEHWQLNLNVPLIYNSPLNSVSPLQEDRDSLDLPTVTDTGVGLCSLNTSVQNRAIPTGLKCTCKTPSCPQCKESTTSSLVSVMLELTSAVPQNVNICKSPLETMDYMGLHGSLLKKTETDKINLGINPLESGALTLREVEPSDQETIQPHSACTENVPGFLLRQHESPKIKGCRGKLNDTHSKDSSNKTTTSKKSSKQGTIVCDVCTACFRTVPGLKRHKAMKHNIKNDENRDVEKMALIHPKNMPLYRKKSETNHADNTASLDYQSSPNGKCLKSCNVFSPEENGSTCKVDMRKMNFEETECERKSAQAAQHKDIKTGPMAKTTVPTASDASEGRTMDYRSFVSQGVNPDQLSDELLDILKTDILQDITSKYPTADKQHEDQEMLNLASLEKHGFYKENSPIVQNELLTEAERSSKLETKSKGDIESHEICGTNDILKENIPDIKEVSEQKVILSEKGIGTEVLGKGLVEIKCETSTCLRDEENDHSLCFKDSTVKSQPSLCLEALLDDESTFSQLFPRDEAMIRKKCARVYSKKNKRHSSVSNVPMTNDKQNSENCNNQTLLQLDDPCKYQTFSMDHAIMLDMSNKSTLENDFEKVISKPDNLVDDNKHAVENNDGLGIGTFSSPANITNCATAVDWSDSKTLNDIVVGPLLSSDAQMPEMSENSGTNCPQQFTDPPVSQSGDLQDSSLFLNIDIQNLNSKFQLPEMPLFDSSKNIPLAMPINNDVEVSNNIRLNKKVTEHRGRKRPEGVLKLRDKQYKCKVCFMWFLTLGELNFHKLSHNPSPPPTCYMCVQRKFSSREQLRDHLREKHAKNKAGIWTCGMCLKEISDVWMYNEHLREHATQFARKGQTQNSILGLPGCFMQEAAVKTFITSIMQHRPSKSSKGEKAKTSSKEAGKTVKENVEQKMLTKQEYETAEINSKRPSDSSRKQMVPSPLRALHKAEASQKTVEMHPNCKDPSRDCHHCGKQFPKPFKLQRHLVVHSLQKIFLCHKCPIFYQDAKELKDHLRNEHKELEEQDSKHTTLYTCELCADVMHVIKKSFICSTCNYTFSKKEQFDRHMEKHLTEGNHIFKFKGVVRPSKPLSSNSRDGDFDPPPNKKRKTATDNLLEISPECSLENISSLQFTQGGDVQVPKSELILTTDLTTGDASPGQQDNSIKTEDTANDFSEILSTFEGSQLFVDSDSPCLSPSLSKEEITRFYPSTKVQTCKVNKEDMKSLSNDYNKNGDGINYAQCEKQATMAVGNSHQHKAAARAECRTSPYTSECNSTVKQPLPKDTTLMSKVNVFQDYVSAANLPSNKDSISAVAAELIKATATAENLSKDTVTVCMPTVEKMSSVECTKELFLDCYTNLSSESETPLKECDPPHCFTDTTDRSTSMADEKEMGNTRQNSGSKPKDENEQKEPKACKTTGQQDDGLLREKGPSKPNESTKRGPISSLKSVTETVTNSSKQKSRKDLKTFQNTKVCSSATRENLDVELRNVKKIRLQSPSKGEGVGSYKKADVTSDYPVLSSVRDDIASNKMLPRHKAGILNLQPKKNPFMNYPLKKAENMRQINGDHRGKKGIPIRPLPASRTSISPVNISLNKCKPHSSLRSVESHSYRTAESQNHLLSQLFGQKLPSFKIPLRKDASESLS